jgi:hypothetical protein
MLSSKSEIRRQIERQQDGNGWQHYAASEKVGCCTSHDAFRANGCPTMEGHAVRRQGEDHTAGQHDASAVAFDHERDEIANEAAGRRIGSAAKRLFESNGGG